MVSNTAHHDVPISTPSNTLTSHWSHNGSEVSMNETFSSNFEDYDILDSLPSYPMYEFDCLQPQALSLSTDVQLEPPALPPFPLESPFPSAESYGSESSIGAVTDLTRQSSISDRLHQSSGDASSIHSTIDTDTIFLFDGSLTGTPLPYEDQLAPPKEQVPLPATEPHEQPMTRSMKEQRASQAGLDDHSDSRRDEPHKPKKLRKSRKKPTTKEEEEINRKRFLERNRVAANKCRQNRKKWIDELQEKFDRVSTENALNKANLEEMTKQTVQLKKKADYLSGICSFISEIPPDLRVTTTQQSEPTDLGSPSTPGGFCPSGTASNASVSYRTLDGLSSHASSPTLSSSLSTSRD